MRTSTTSIKFLLNIPLAFLLLASSLWSMPGLAQGPEPGQAAANRNNPPIQLISRTFTPSPGLDPALVALQATGISEPRHMLVQLWSIPSEPERAALEAAGVRLLNYIPTNTWLASVTGSLDLAAPTYALIRWAGPLLPMDKIDPFILQQGVRSWAVGPDGQVQLLIYFFEDVPAAQASEIIARYGGQIDHASNVSPRYIAWFPNAKMVTALAGEDGVQWIESGPAPKTTHATPPDDGADNPITVQNDLARLRTKVNELQTQHPEITGNGVVIAIVDGGRVADHPDFTGRLTVRTQDALDTDAGGHATHVAGTAAGDGRLSIERGGTANQWRGVAPAATILSYSFNDPDIDADHKDAVTNYNLDVSQNSWGITINDQNCNDFGDYIDSDQMFDEVIAGKHGKGVVAAIAVGNDRSDAIDGNWCGITDGYRTIGPPGGAKNGIGVGAVMSEDDAMTPFSNWGPTDDGRIKPDVVAPGSSAAQQIKSTIVEGAAPNYTYNYGPLQGTSMATPHVSGIATLLVQRYKAVFSKNSLPSTIKALLIHTADDLDDATSYYNPGPDYASGYGRVNALAAYNALTVNNVREDEVANGVTDTFSTTVSAGANSLKVTLVWDDPAATANAGGATLINNLDLELVAPDGTTTHLPWVLDPNNPGNDASKGVDTLNNMEQVLVNSPAEGTWTIRVKGTSVPQGPQKYSLIGAGGGVSGQATNTYLPSILK